MVIINKLVIVFSHGGYRTLWRKTQERRIRGRYFPKKVDTRANLKKN